MKTKSIKFNFLMNNIRLLSNLIFPLITFPYVSRILLADGIGKIAFSGSVINYFILLANLGIPLYGIREVAKVRDCQEKLNKIVSEILIINFICLIISYTLFFIMFTRLEIFKSDQKLFLIMSLNIIFTSIGIEWFYKGIEQYQYIATRSIFVKVISAVLMFYFVKEKNDYLVWASITVLSLVGANIFNFINARKYFVFKIRNCNFKKHLKPITIIFSTTVAISVYTNLDSTMLGIYSTSDAVGIYSASIKINKIVLALVTSLGAVLIPRLTYYLEQKDYKSYYKLGNDSINFILFMTIPSIIGLYILSPELINLFAGNEFLEAIIPMRLMLPIILIIALTNFIGIQILYPNNQEKKVMYSVIIGAIINFSLNYLLIPKYSYIGAAIATVIGEGSVLGSQIILGKRYLKFKLFNENSTKYFLASIVMLIVLLISKSYFYINHNALEIIKQIVIGVLVYITGLVFLNEENTIKFFKKIRKKEIENV